METKLPEFLEGPTIEEDKIGNKDVEVINIQLSKLNSNANEFEVKKKLFKNMHVINLETEMDNLTGKCSGSGYA
eukprot:CAMPEP_0170548516 /NCGR_PEP_ID=MMETSP0211-20121228/6820_1 /TAXON_ID=311385 /ORGANISM="Pseudokeronopsis sp., Strain OXSARD2" /LENGTH=73 /DNA_ID=CAMNT_0010854107 /DNA_START=1276 /DNA_END=1497 /DNA_ORIENTATION=-